MSASHRDPELVFHWPGSAKFSVLLFLCMAGSLFAHAATFFLFQVVYPTRVTIPQPAPHVSLLRPSSPENIALLRWIEAEDPALIARDNSVSPPGIGAVRYRPSFATPRTLPLGAPPEQPQPVRFPPAIDHLTATTAPAPLAPPAAAAAPTVIQFLGELASRGLARNPPVAPHPLPAPVTPTILLLGVDAEGAVRFQFLQQSSGDEALDAHASAHLRRLRFAPAEPEITWAHAAFTWGNDGDPSPSRP